MYTNHKGMWWEPGHKLHSCSFSAVDRDERSDSHPGPFAQGQRAPGTHWTGGEHIY